MNVFCATRCGYLILTCLYGTDCSLSIAHLYKRPTMSEELFSNPFSIWWILRPTLWGRLWCQVLKMSNLTFHTIEAWDSVYLSYYWYYCKYKGSEVFKYQEIFSPLWNLQCRYKKRSSYSGRIPFLWYFSNLRKNIPVIGLFTKPICSKCINQILICKERQQIYYCQC